jgi:hypothetical protein
MSEINIYVNSKNRKPNETLELRENSKFRYNLEKIL